MRVLPRTRRGVWLTAAAAWLAGCAWLWWLLPPVPRAERHYGERLGLPQILPVGPTFVAGPMRDQATPDWLVWNPGTGDVKWAPDQSDQFRVRFSPDGRW